MSAFCYTNNLDSTTGIRPRVTIFESDCDNRLIMEPTGELIIREDKNAEHTMTVKLFQEEAETLLGYLKYMKTRGKEAGHLYLSICPRQGPNIKLRSDLHGMACLTFMDGVDELSFYIRECYYDLFIMSIKGVWVI